MESTQRCPICGVETGPSQRYPHYVCRACVTKAVDESGRLLEIENADSESRISVKCADTGEQRSSNTFYISGKHCYAEEAHFGGVVVRISDKSQITAPSQIPNPQHIETNSHQSVAESEMATQDELTYLKSAVAEKVINSAAKVGLATAFGYILIVYIAGLNGFFREYSLIIALGLGWLASRIVVSSFER